MPDVQDVIHKLEVGGGVRGLKVALGILAALSLALLYNFRCYKNFSTQEAMDSAQVGRNMAEGRGYTTLFVRPFSLFLVKRHNQQNPTPATAGDPSQIKDRHPDLANPPVYPTVLAGLMK